MSTRIQPQTDGPLQVEGDTEIIAADGTRFPKQSRLWLCRCGHSANKPFCDGAHNKAGFSDAGAVPEDYVIRKPDPGEPGETVRLALRNDGPIHCLGELEILGAGATRWRGTQANLCRCGESANKPFCDGTHRSAGFRSS